MSKNRIAALVLAHLASCVSLTAIAEETPSPPTAPPGVTAVSGRVVGPDGAGLGGIKIADNTQIALTDAQGQFLLAYIPAGKSTLRIDGRRGGAQRTIDYGVYEAEIVAFEGRTLILPYKSWLTPIDHAHDVAISSPTTSEVVIRNPSIPNLELLIAAGVVIRDIDGNVVTSVGLTSMPIDKTPVPLARGSRAPSTFTIQPGAACLYDRAGGIGTARIRYPNYLHELPGARANVWRYEPDTRGWTQYGVGVVSDDGSQVIPESRAVITDFSSAECDPATGSQLEMPRPMLVRGTVP